MRFTTARNPGIEFTATVSADSSDARAEPRLLEIIFRLQLQS